MENLDVLYRDEHFIAVNKPSGLLVHRSPIDRRETRFALQIVRNMIGQHVYPVHRLDKPTSGVLIFGLSPEAARGLGEVFEARRVEKTYLAVTRGVVEEEGLIDSPLVEEPDRRAPGQDKEAEPKDAVTSYRRLAEAELPFAVGRYPASRYCLVELRPRTGRRHQLRRHLKHILHPIVGDTTHGEGRHNRFFREHFGCHRLLLAAVELRFTHPFTKEEVRVTAPLDETFLSVLDRLQWRDSLAPSWLPSQEAVGLDGLGKIQTTESLQIESIPLTAVTSG